MLKKFIGDKQFYKSVLAITMPVVLQGSISCIVNMLDNIMLGQVGTEQMTGVAISNQLLSIYIMLLCAVFSASSIFATQFYGNGDTDGIRHVFRFNILSTLVFFTAFTVFLLLCGDSVLMLFLNSDGNSAESVALTFESAKTYLIIALASFFPYSVSQIFCSILNACGKTVATMLSSAIAMVSNFIFNYILIFGKIGFPAMGVKGAALATLCSRILELSFLVIYTLVTRKENRFIIGAFKSLYFPFGLFKKLLPKGLSLMASVGIWSIGNTFVNQCFSTRGIDALAAYNISQTFNSVFTFAANSFGTSIFIMLGHLIGAGKREQVRDHCRKHIALAEALSLVFGALFFICAQYIPFLYNTSDEVHHIATALMRVLALTYFIDCFSHVAGFALRAGGDMKKVFFPNILHLTLNIPAVFVLSRVTDLSIVWLLGVFQLLNIIKGIFNYCFLKSDKWIHKVIE